MKTETNVLPEDANLQCFPVEQMIAGAVADRVPVLYQH